MKIEINIQTKHVLVMLLFMIAASGISLVVAYGGNTPALTGHTWGEMVCDSTLCVNPSSGNVGIGTTNPTQKLDVNGYVKAQSGLCMGSDCKTSWQNVTGNINKPIYLCPSNSVSSISTCTLSYSGSVQCWDTYSGAYCSDSDCTTPFNGIIGYAGTPPTSCPTGYTTSSTWTYTGTDAGGWWICAYSRTCSATATLFGYVKQP